MGRLWYNVATSPVVSMLCTIVPPPPPPPFSLFGTTLQPKTNWFNLCTTLHYHCYNKLFNSQFLAFTAAFAMVFSLINMHSLYTICQRVHGYVKCTNRTSTVGTAKINQSIILSTWQPCQKQSDCIHRTSCLATGCFHMSGCYGNTTMQTFPGIKGTCHSGQWFLVAFLVISSLGQLVVIAHSVPDSLVQAFFAIAFLSQLV